MKRILIVAALVLVLFEQTPRAQMVHPGGWHTQADLTRIRANVSAGKDPWITGWNAIQNKSPDAGYKTRVSPKITSNGAMSGAGFASWVLTMKWVASGDQAYADAAIGIINDWVETVVDFDVYGPTLTLSTGAGAMAQAAEILEHGFEGEAGWPASEARAAKVWFKKVIYDPWTNTGRMRSTNWGTSCVGGNMSMAIFCDDMSMFEYQCDAFLHGYQDTDDGSCAVTDYIFDASGQAQESGRDQAHVQGGIAHLTEAALCAWNQGVDLVSTAENRLLAGVEYHAKYNLGYDDLPFTKNVYNPANLPLIPKWSHAISEDERGIFSPVYCMSSKLFTLAELDHPYTKEVIASPGYAPEINNFAHPGLGTLVFVSTPHREDGENMVLDESLMKESPSVSGAWMVYGASRLAWVNGKFKEQYPKAKQYQFSFEEELEARTAMATVWEESKSKDDTLNDLYLDDLVTIKKSGFLKEYVWQANRSEGWKKVPDLKLEEFKEWGRKNIPKHKPQTRVAIK
jgi:hypothetical protein